jgi:hypothetical protein
VSNVITRAIWHGFCSRYGSEFVFLFAYVITALMSSYTVGTLITFRRDKLFFLSHHVSFSFLLISILYWVFPPPLLLHFSAFLLLTVRYFYLLFHSFAFPSSVSFFFSHSSFLSCIICVTSSELRGVPPNLFVHRCQSLFPGAIFCASSIHLHDVTSSEARL